MGGHHARGVAGESPDQVVGVSPPRLTLLMRGVTPPSPANPPIPQSPNPPILANFPQGFLRIEVDTFLVEYSDDVIRSEKLRLLAGDI